MRWKATIIAVLSLAGFAAYLDSIFSRMSATREIWLYHPESDRVLLAHLGAQWGSWALNPFAAPEFGEVGMVEPRGQLTENLRQDAMPRDELRAAIAEEDAQLRHFVEDRPSIPAEWANWPVWLPKPVYAGDELYTCLDGAVVRRLEDNTQETLPPALSVLQTAEGVRDNDLWFVDVILWCRGVSTGSVHVEHLPGSFALGGSAADIVLQSGALSGD